MSSREVLLAVYAGILGWYLHEWWRGTREDLIWHAADRALTRMSLWEASRPPKAPEPSAAT